MAKTRTKKQERTDELFDAVVYALKAHEAKNEEALIVCSAAVGFYLATIEETPSERVYAMKCAMNIALGMMARTLEAEDEAEKPEAVR